MITEHGVLQAIFLLIIFITGIIIIAIKFFLKKKISKIGLLLVIIPIAVPAGILIYSTVSNRFFLKPGQLDLVGRYHISNITVTGLNKTSYRNCVLIFNRDSTFSLTPTPYVDVCEKGKYEVDYDFDYNEIAFKCSNFIIPAHMDRHWNSYDIEFIVGDPDSGESIYFEKDK